MQHTFKLGDESNVPHTESIFVESLFENSLHLLRATSRSFQIMKALVLEQYCKEILDVNLVTIGVPLIRVIQQICIKAYVLSCVSWLLTTLFLYVFNATHYRSVDMIEHACAYLQGGIPISQF